MNKATAQTLADKIVSHSSLAKLSDKQREIIKTTVIAVETNPHYIRKRGRRDYFLGGLCFGDAQAMAHASKGRIGYVEGCLVDLNHNSEPDYGSDATRAGRFHHGLFHPLLL